MTKWQIMAFLTHDGTPEVVLPDGRRAVVQGFRRESCSGRSFMMTVSADCGRKVGQAKLYSQFDVYVTTID